MTGWIEQAGHLLLTGHVVALLLRTSPSILKAGKSKRGTLPSWPTLTSHTLSFQQTDLCGRDSPFTKLQSIGPCVCTPLMGPLVWVGKAKSRPWVWGVVLLSLHRGRPQWPSAEMNWTDSFPDRSYFLSYHSSCCLDCQNVLLWVHITRKPWSSSSNLLRMGQDQRVRWPCSSTSQRVCVSYSHWGIRIRIYVPGGDKAHFSWERWLPNEPLKPRNDKADDLNAFSLVEIQFILFFPLIFFPGLTFSSTWGKTAHRSTK